MSNKTQRFSKRFLKHDAAAGDHFCRCDDCDKEREAMGATVTQSKAQHTPGLLDILEGKTLYHVETLNKGDGSLCGVPVCSVTKTPQGLANASRLVLCWNTHDELVAALKECLPAIAGRTCSCNDDRDCQPCHASRKARAAIAKTEKEEA